MTQRYEYNENGEITNVKPEIDQPDFRSYPAYPVTHKGLTYNIKTCCEKFPGSDRWEYFVCYASGNDARIARQAHGLS